MDKIEVKFLKVSKELHKKLKKEAVEREITIYELLKEIISTYFNGR